MGISHVSGFVEIVGDFSLINPYGVRVKGFLWWSLRVKGLPKLAVRVEGVPGEWVRVEGSIT